MSSTPGVGRSPVCAGKHSNPLHYSCLENPMERGSWWVMVHRVTKGQMQQSNLAHMHAQAQSTNYQIISQKSRTFSPIPFGIFQSKRQESTITASLQLSQLRICLQHRRPRFDSWVGKIPWRRKWQSTPVFLPGESYGQRSLVGYSPRGHKSQTRLSD